MTDDVITAAEKALTARIKTAFDNTLKAVESLPADWDTAMFSRILRLSPGVFVVFSGGNPSKGTIVDALMQANFTCVVVTTHATEEARRRGDSREIGAYQIIVRLVRLLHGHTIDDIGTLQFNGVQNLFTGALEKQGATIYSVDFVIPVAFGDGSDDPSTLDNFLRFDGFYDPPPVNVDVVPPDEPPIDDGDLIAAHDTVNLEPIP